MSKRDDSGPSAASTSLGSYLGAPQRSGGVDTAAIVPRDGRYEVRSFIAAGGMGEIWRVFDHRMMRELAMKVLAPQLMQSARAVDHFANEARVTARLQHPSIVAVHDIGELADGRPFYTMKEVRGETYLTVIRSHHRRETGAASLTALVEVLLRTCEAVEYAHDSGIVHRDLKPHNIMVGRFGEVQVMDWGLACTLANTARGADGNVSSPRVAGTTGYMCPEQAAGEPVSAQWDVYAIGAIIHHVLEGKPPGPPKPGRTTTDADAPRGRLAHLAARAMGREQRGFEDVTALRQALAAWHDRVSRRERALAHVAEADAQWCGDDESEGIESARARLARLRRAARQALNDVRDYDPISQKRPAWGLEDEANALAHELAVREVEWQHRLRSALNEDAELEAAHVRLADYYRSELELAEARNDGEAAKRAETQLALHDRGQHRAYLRGDATLTLITDPPGAKVSAYRFIERDRHLVETEAASLGRTPLTYATLQAGSYLLVLEAPDRHPVRLPVWLPRGGSWPAAAPPPDESPAVILPRSGGLGELDCLVPGGWFISGGDTAAVDATPRRRVWVDGFVIRRHPVTRGEYVEYLNALLDAGELDEADARGPKRLLGYSRNGPREDAWPRAADGRFQLDPSEASSRQARWPMTFVDWDDACAYARWRARSDGLAWRLPTELEWEKAARGVDGRRYPWGDHFDATFACVAESHEDEASLASVDDYPVDVSVYGVAGLGGNVRDWCLDTYRRDGPLVVGERAVLTVPGATSDELRVCRGGAWISAGERALSASRFADSRRLGHSALGFRLARSYGNR